MRRELIVGDPHVTVEDMGDCHKLMEFVAQVASTQKVDRITILGDLHHNHALMNVRVMAFWKEWFAKLHDSLPATRVYQDNEVVALVGNHDMPGDGSQYPHALLAYENVFVVDKPRVLDNTLYLPYYSEPNLFIEATRGYPDIKTLICHQEFQGAKYESGYFTPNGVPVSEVVQPIVISGHIHSPQNVGKVWYPGAPRWRTLSDADTFMRSIHVVTFDDAGEVVQVQGYATNSVVRRIVRLIFKEGETVFRLAVEDKDDIRATIEGSTAWVDTTEAALRREHPNWKLSTVRTDIKAIRIKESDGIPVAFKKYVSEYVIQFGSREEH